MPRWFVGSARGQSSLPALLFITILCVLGLWVVDGQPIQAQQPSPTYSPDQVTPPAVEPSARRGRASYLENCAPCHGLQGMGNGPTAADLPGPPTAFADPQVVWERSPAELFHTTKFGRLEKLMPPWSERLNDAQIWDTVYYAWSLHTAEQDVTGAMDLYAASCANCHGAGGAGDGPDAGDGAIPDFTDGVYAMVRSQADWLAGWQAAHPELGAGWSEIEQRNVLEYIRTFSYLPPWASPYRPANGVIVGYVTQGTQGAADPAGQVVSLEAYVDFEPVATFTATVGMDGAFEFTDLAVDEGIVYLASTPYGGIRYSSPVVTLSAAQPATETDIVVYEGTDDASGLAIERMHWIVDSQPGGLVVGQIYSFGNQGDRTYLGAPVEGIDQPATIAMYVPEGVEAIEFENGTLGDRFRQVGNWVYDTTPVVPGEDTRQVIMRYVLPYAGRDLDLAQEFRYPVQTMNLLIADLPSLEVESPALEFASTETLQGRPYQLWRMQSAGPESLQVSLSGLLEAGDVDPRAFDTAGASAAGASASAAGVPLLEPWMVWLLASLLVVTFGGVLLGSHRQGLVSASEQSRELRQQRDVLIQRIAHLDDLHAMGELNDELWRKERAPLKAQLLDLSARMDEQ